MTENIKEALEYAVELAEDQEKIIETIDGTEYYDAHKHDLRELDPIKYPQALKLNSLTGLVRYIEEKLDIDDFDKERFIINVESPTRVSFVSELDEDEKRAVYAVAEAITPEYKFDYFYPIETFNIKLSSAFCKTEARQTMLQLSSAIKIDNGVQLSDDGVSQIATVKSGVASVNQAKLPNPVPLKPYRTFLEVDQPESEFIFRLNDQPGAALYEADGSMWQLTAKENIASYLAERLESISNVCILA